MGKAPKWILDREHVLGKIILVTGHSRFSAVVKRAGTELAGVKRPGTSSARVPASGHVKRAGTASWHVKRAGTR